MPAYLIADIEVVDAAAFEEYRKQIPAVIAAHGGRYLARGGATEVLEGDWAPRRAVIVEFQSMAALKAFYDAPDYRSLRELRQRATKTNLVAVEGIG
jgi:uncharacterized protein (DUF1330 family)